MAVEQVTMKEAARRLDMSEESLRCCMRQRSLPMNVGIAWRGRHTKQWNYRIFRKPFEELMEVLGEEREK